mmetsp:Transcript_26684/g.67872  ORF Transcript_26684/g.67872 Transcript_26684/m.67872 type:complete len:266 (-) Transcript_26684:196-993(-)
MSHTSRRRHRAAALRLEEANLALRRARVILCKEEPRKGELVDLAPLLYSAIMSRNLKIAEVVRSWDRDGDGTIDLSEFRRSVQTMVKHVSDAEVRDAFDAMNVDGSGSLPLGVVSAALKSMEQAAAKAKEQESTLTSEAKACKKAVLDLQFDLVNGLKKLEAEELERERQTELQEKAREEAERQAEQAAKEAKAAKAANAAREKAAFEARVSEKRKGGLKTGLPSINPPVSNPPSSRPSNPSSHRPKPPLSSRRSKGSATDARKT